MAFGDNGVVKYAESASDYAANDEAATSGMINSAVSYIDGIASENEKESSDIDWNTVLSNAKKHPDQKKSTTIAVGTDGKPVNMDLWEYTLLDDGTYALNDSDALEGTTKSAGYSNDNIVNGKIQGTIPQYIKGESDETFKEVTSLQSTFRENTSLEEPPIIPTTINNMLETFAYCDKLNQMPQIPNGVINMASTFYYCNNLQNICNIPNSVKMMDYAFYNCKSIINAPKLSSNLESMLGCFRECSQLINIPEIPNSVKMMDYAFYNCKSIINAPKLSSNLESMLGCFRGCSQLINMPEIPSKVTEMADSFRDCINLKTATTIPNSVINMRSAFNGCSNLQGIIEINANLTGKITEDGYEDYFWCLANATTNNGITLKVTGNCIVLDKIVENASNPNIHL